MSTSNRLISAVFTALPGFGFLALFLAASLLGKDYWWETYLVVLVFLVIASLILGFALPPILSGTKLRKPWAWIAAQGFLSWGLALVALGLLNLTPLCVGQNNGDGRNDLFLCLLSTAASGIVYTPVYLTMLGMSAGIGQWIMKSMRTSGTSS